MDIRSFRASSSKSTDIISSIEDGSKSSKADTECLEPSPAKRQWSSSTVHEKHRSSTDYLQAIESTRRNEKRASLG